MPVAAILPVFLAGVYIQFYRAKEDSARGIHMPRNIPSTVDPATSTVMRRGTSRICVQ